jgi:hypothetical protein
MERGFEFDKGDRNDLLEALDRCKVGVTYVEYFAIRRIPRQLSLKSTKLLVS